MPAALGVGATTAVTAFLILNRPAPPAARLTPIVEEPAVEPVLDTAIAEQPPAAESLESFVARLAEAPGVETPSPIGTAVDLPGSPEAVAPIARATPPPTVVPLRAETSPPPAAATTLTLSPPGPIDPGPAPARAATEPPETTIAEAPSASAVVPVSPSGPPAEDVEAPAPPPSASAAVSTSPAPAPPPATPLPETGPIERALGRYRSAFSALDAGAARQIWPTVNERALRRAFDGLQTQDLSFEACLIDVTGLRAEASCNGTARYVRKIGGSDTHVERRRWKFSLRKVSDDWLIETVDAR